MWCDRVGDHAFHSRDLFLRVHSIQPEVIAFAIDRMSADWFGSRSAWCRSTTAPPDPEPKQIVLQVKFASVDRAVLNQFGINLISRNPNTLGATSTVTNADGSVTVSQTATVDMTIAKLLRPSMTLTRTATAQAGAAASALRARSTVTPRWFAVSGALLGLAAASRYEYLLLGAPIGQDCTLWSERSWQV